MTNEDSLIPAEARRAIGEQRTIELGEISLRDLQRYAVAAQDDSPRYFDVQVAGETAYRGLIAPPNMLTAMIGWEVGPDESALRADGLPQSTERRPPLRVKRVMGAGQELEFRNPVRPGDRFTRTDKVVEMTQREGRTGPMVITVTEQTYRNQSGEIAVICRSTSIAR
ncbi:MAG TPA: hypothetical protein DEV93_10590 [Chloroflexi bacterium]|jgi:acyl dehydratase|nr:hypothetical protein [Chloroflexota bacterium]